MAASAGAAGGASADADAAGGAGTDAKVYGSRHFSGLACFNYAEMKRAEEGILAWQQREDKHVLDVTSCGILTLPDVFSRHWDGQFTSFCCSYNHLKELPQNLTTWTQLKALHCAMNNITAMPDGLNTLTSLVHFDVSSNLVKEIPLEVAYLPNLVRFHCTDNCLEEFPCPPESWPSLEHLECSSNYMKDLPRRLGTLPKLTVLVCTGNPWSQEWIAEVSPRLIAEYESGILNPKSLGAVPDELFGELPGGVLPGGATLDALSGEKPPRRPPKDELPDGAQYLAFGELTLEEVQAWGRRSLVKPARSGD